MANPTDKDRLDRVLVARGLCATRSRARDAIGRGTVRVDGRTADKPGMIVRSDATITVNDPAQAYVSRAALKLTAALEAFDVPIANAVCLDLGASTGGFTQVLIKHGAMKVHAIDVGHGQLDASLRSDARIALIERLNARDLALDHLGGDRPVVIVCDVSFISLEVALPPALALAAEGAHLVALVKPQFEVGRDRIGKGGLVAPDDADAAAVALETWVNDQDGWMARAVIPSPITGGDGNREFLLWAVKEGAAG